MVTLGVTFRLMTRARGPIGGARTAWWAYATASSAFVLRSRFGTVVTLSLRSEFSGSPAPEAITARTPRNTGGTATPTASWLRWRCHYPQAVFPYPRLREERARRTRDDPEFELLDGDRYWQIAADYAKAAPDDILIRVTARNAGPEPAELHILPTLWFRNRWSWKNTVAKPVVVRDASNGTECVAIAEEVMLGA
jgi:hypothetical protein